MKILGFVVMLLIFFGIGFYMANITSDPEIVSITKTDTIKGDSIPYVVEVEKPVPKYIDTGSTRTITKYKDVDTSQIIADYFSEVVYDDTLKNDSNAYIRLSDTLYMNRVVGRALWFQNRKNTKIITNKTIVNYKRDGIYLGGNIGLRTFGFDVMYLNNKDMYGVGLDALTISENIKYFFTFKYKRLIWKKPSKK